MLPLPAEGPPPADPRVQLRFRPVGRVWASLRTGRWDDRSAEVVPVTPQELLDVVTSFGGLPIHGGQFFHVSEQPSDDCTSLDWRSGEDGLSHRFRVFQEGPDRFIEIVAWFDEFYIVRPDGSSLSVEDFIAAGLRAWDPIYAGDPRADGFGISAFAEGDDV